MVCGGSGDEHPSIYIYIHIHMHNLAESRIFSVPFYSSNIDVEFVASIENEEFSANDEIH